MKTVKTVSDYFRLYKELKLQDENSEIIKVAILSSSTINGVKEILTVNNKVADFAFK